MDLFSGMIIANSKAVLVSAEEDIVAKARTGCEVLRGLKHRWSRLSVYALTYPWVMTRRDISD